MPNINERIDDAEEATRSAIRGELKRLMTSLPVMVSVDGDGHTTGLRVTVKGQIIQPDGTVKQVEYPQLLDVPIHFPGGGGVSMTHPIKKGDEGVAIILSRSQDAWHQSGGVQSPIDNRMHSMSDARYIPGGRSNPRKLKNVSNDSHQTRSDDGKQTIDVHPKKGMTIKSVDPEDKADNPYKDAKKFHASSAGPSGISHEATNNGVTHKSSVDHSSGAKMSANNGAHEVNAHPSNGVKLKSSVAVNIEAPALGLPAKIIAALALADGAASENVGPVGGDLSGTLPNPKVISILNVAGADSLKNHPNDAAAASDGVEVGHLYRNGSVLMVRVV